MIVSIFDFFFSALSCAWNILGWIADTSIRFLGAVFSFGIKAVGGVFDLMLTPFTRGIDWLWDCGGLDLKSIFVVVMWVLLTACALLAIFAAGSNAYRRYRQRINK